MTTRTERLVDAGWKQISEAVTEGLKEKDDASLAQICPEVKRSGDLRDHVQLGWTAELPGPLGVAQLEASAGSVHQLSARRCVPISRFDPLLTQTEDLTDWAKSVRASELRWALTQLVFDLGGSEGELSSDTELPGNCRLFVFEVYENLKHWARSRGVDLTVLSGLTDRAGLPEAIALPPDTTAISRLEPFELSWDTTCTCNADNGNQHVTLLLTERIELVKMPDPPTVLTFATVGTFSTPAPTAGSSPIVTPG